MNEEQRIRFNEILARVPCEHGHRCAQADVAETCKTRDLGLENYVDCLSYSSHACQFALGFGHGHLCSCPARIFLAKYGV